MKSSTAGFAQALIDLVNDMGNVPYAAIVVGFENNTGFEFVMYSSSISRAELVGQLNRLIRSGGKPLGLIGFVLKVLDETPRNYLLSVGHPYSKPFPKYSKKRWAHDLLARIAESYQERLMKMREVSLREHTARECAASLN